MNTKLWVALNKQRQDLPLTNEQKELIAKYEAGRPKKKPRGKQTERAEPPKDEPAARTIRSNTIGFWKHGQRLYSSTLVKSRIPNYSHLLLIKCSHKASAKSPEYVGYFTESKVPPEEIKHPYIALKGEIDYEFGEEEEPRDLATEIFDWMFDHQDRLLDAIHGGFDSSGIIYDLERRFNEE